MKYCQLDEIRHALRAKGYSRSYVARLVSELHDHLETTREFTGDDEFDSRQGVERRLGSTSTLLAAVEDHPELRSCPQRFSFWTFVVFPGIAVCLLTVCFVYLAESIARGDLIGNRSMNLIALRMFGLATFVVSMLLGVSLAVMAVRARVHVIFLAAAMLLVSASGLFIVDLVYRKVTAAWKQDSQQAIGDWQRREGDPASLGPFEREVLRPRLLQAAQSLQKMLTPSQDQRLRQVMYQQLGWDALFLDSTLREVGISYQQEVQLKGLLIERTLRDTKLRRLAVQRQEGFADELRALELWFESQILEILTVPQEEKFHDLQGPPCLLPGQLTIKY